MLRNLGTRVKGERIVIPGLVERIDYTGLATRSIEPSARIPLDLVQARYALDIAGAADAQRYAAAEFDKASQLLASAESAPSSKRWRDRKPAPRLAREAVQMAEDARRAAVRGKLAADAAATAEAAALTARQVAEAEARRNAERELQASQAREQQAAERAAMKARADLVARLNRALPTRETARGIVAEIAGVQFATAAANLNPSARESLARFAGIVGVYRSMRFQVEGHTDSTGSETTNRALSLQRGITVRDYLIGQGVAASKIDVTGLGSDRPVADNGTADGRAQNRRVEIVITGGPIVAQ